MNIIGIIPARFQSTRFPGKPLADINGKSMIRRVYEEAEKVSAFSKIIVATDDMRILEHVESFGGKAMMTSSSHASGTDRCGEVVNTLPGEYDVVVNIQGDEPFIQPEQLNKVIAAFQGHSIEIVTLAKKISDHIEMEDPNVVKVVFDKKNHALYFSRSIIPYNRNNKMDIAYYKHIGIYAYRTDILQQIITLPQGNLEQVESLEQLRWLENGYSIHVEETTIETIGIDTPEDLEKIRTLKT